MKKKENAAYLIALILFVLVGSIVTFYSTNLVLSDVSNAFYGLQDALIISSLPGLMFAFDFVLFILATIRYHRTPMYRKKMMKTHSVVLASFSFVGFITSILTGTVIYKSFVTSYPFYGYTIICLVLHLLILIASLYFRIFYIKKIKDDEATRKVSFKYVIYTAVSAILLFIAMNRFGAVLFSPWYIHWRTFYLTWPFYLWMMMPLAQLIVIGLYFYGILEGKTKLSLFLSNTFFLISLVCGIYTLVMGSMNTKFISVISPALPIERLATEPIEVIMLMIITVGIGVVQLIISIKKKFVADHQNRQA